MSQTPRTASRSWGWEAAFVRKPGLEPWPPSTNKHCVLLELLLCALHGVTNSRDSVLKMQVNFTELSYHLVGDGK